MITKYRISFLIQLPVLLILTAAIGVAIMMGKIDYVDFATNQEKVAEDTLSKFDDIPEFVFYTVSILLWVWILTMIF